MQLDDLVFVTSNRGKVREAEAVLGRALDHLALDLPEIQSLDLEEVVRAKVAAAWQQLQRPGAGGRHRPRTRRSSAVFPAH